MGFKINGKDLDDYAEKEYYTTIANKKSSFFNSNKVSITGLSKTGTMVADAPKDKNWYSNFLPDAVKLNGLSVNASYRGCRPKYVERISVSNGSYSIAVVANGANYSLVLKSENNNTLIKDLGKNTTGFCYVLLHAPGGSGAVNWPGIGGRSGGGGGSGACIFSLVKVTNSNPIELIVGDQCRLGNTNQYYCLVNKGGDALERNGGGTGSYEQKNTSLTKYVWINGYSVGASGGYTDASGETPLHFSSSDSTPDSIRFDGRLGGRSGSGGGGGGAGSNLASGGNGGGGNGDSGGTGAGGGGASYQVFNKYYGGSGGSAIAKIYY